MVQQVAHGYGGVSAMQQGTPHVSAAASQSHSLPHKPI